MAATNFIYKLIKYHPVRYNFLINLIYQNTTAVTTAKTCITVTSSSLLQLISASIVQFMQQIFFTQNTEVTRFQQTPSKANTELM